MRGKEEGMGGSGGWGGERWHETREGRKQAATCTRTYAHVSTYSRTHSRPSMIISQDTGKASVSRHEAQERTLGGAGEKEEELQRGTPPTHPPQLWLQAGRAGSPPEK